MEQQDRNELIESVEDDIMKNIDYNNKFVFENELIALLDKFDMLISTTGIEKLKVECEVDSLPRISVTTIFPPESPRPVKTLRQIMEE